MVLNNYDYAYLVTGIFGTYIIYKFMAIFFDRSKVNKRIEFLSYSIYFIIISLMYLNVNIPIVNLAVNLILFLLLTFNYQSSIKNRIFAFIFIYLTLMVIETIVALILFHVYSSIFSTNDRNTSIIGMISVNIVSYIFVLLIGNYNDIKKGIDIPNIYWVSIFLIPLGSLYVILILLQTFNLRIPSIIASIIILFSINIVVFYLYDALNKAFEDKLEKLTLKEQNKYYQSELKIINNSYKNIKSLEHDMKNYLLALEGYIEKEEKEKALDYIFQINNTPQKNKEFSNTGNIEIDSILNYKLQEAESKGILVALELKIPSIINIASSHIVMILGNLLDNAIEASAKIDDDKRIDIRIIYKNNVLFIYINNTFDGTVIYEGDKIITTKKDKENHGIGLNSIKNILNKYDGTIKAYNTENKFYVEILMYIE